MKSIVIVVDMQNDFITGPLGSPQARAIVPLVTEKIKNAAREGRAVWFTMDTHGGDYLKTNEGVRLPVAHCIRGSEGWRLNSDIEACAAKTMRRVEKNAFGSLRLAMELKDEFSDIAQIELCGVCTDICVVSNALILKAAFPDALILVDGSCCAGTSPAKHDAALETMLSCQIDVY